MDSDELPAPLKDVVYDKKAILDELRKAFGRCTYFVHRSHRVPLVQRMEFVKTMTYLSQVICSLEKEVKAKVAHENLSAENNMRAIECLQKDGIIEIKDMRKLRVLMGCEEKEEATEGTPCSPQS